MPDNTSRFAKRNVPAPPPLHERMAAQTRSLNTPMECPKCGSTFFTDVHFAQYNDGGYGSVQFRLLTVTPVQAKQCGCGYLLWPRPSAAKIAPGSDPEFQRSMKMSAAYREQQETRAEEVPSLRELRQLENKIEELQAQLEELVHMKPASHVVPRAKVEIELNPAVVDTVVEEAPAELMTAAPLGVMAAPPVAAAPRRNQRNRRG